MPDELVPSNAVLESKLDALREMMSFRFDEEEKAHQGIKDRLDRMNGQVAKNTEFRVKGSVYLGFMVFIASTAFTLLLARLGF